MDFFHPLTFDPLHPAFSEKSNTLDYVIHSIAFRSQNSRHTPEKHHHHILHYTLLFTNLHLSLIQSRASAAPLCAPNHTHFHHAHTPHILLTLIEHYHFFSMLIHASPPSSQLPPDLYLRFGNIKEAHYRDGIQRVSQLCPR